MIYWTYTVASGFSVLRLLIRVLHVSFKRKRWNICDNFTQEEGDVQVRCQHSPLSGSWHHILSRWNPTTSPLLYLKNRQPRTNQVDESDIIPGVGLGVPDELGANVVPGLCPGRLAFEYDGGMGHERVAGVAGDEEVEELPVVPGPDFGAIGHGTGGEMLIQDPAQKKAGGFRKLEAGQSRRNTRTNSIFRSSGPLD